MKRKEFAAKLNYSEGYVSQLCSGARVPTDRTIADICRVFHVNESWLRDGVGEMFTAQNVNEQISEFFADVLTDDTSFKYQLIKFLSMLPPEAWDAVGKKAQELAENGKGAE